MGFVSKMYNIPWIEEKELESMLAQVDICLIGIPYGARKPYLDLCKTYKKGVIVEKPFAFSEKEHIENCQGFEKWNIAVNFQRRFYNTVGVLQNLVNAEIFGKVVSIKFMQGNFSIKGGSSYLSDVKLAGGGVIADSAIHALDIVLGITNATEVAVNQFHCLSKKGIDYDSAMDASIVANGRSIPVHCEISMVRNFENGLYIDFENALVFSDLSPNGDVVVKEKKEDPLSFSVMDSPYFHPLKKATKINQAFVIFWEQVKRALDAQSTNESSACNSMLTSKWMGEIYKLIQP